MIAEETLKKISPIDKIMMDEKPCIIDIND